MIESTTHSRLKSLLVDGLLKLNLEPLEYPVDQYLAYIRLLAQWNTAYNLTGIKDPFTMVSHHILDSLAIRPNIQGPDCLDVGTGAGFPGIPLALSAPDQDWLLVDSTRKKIRFLQQAIIELDISNISLKHTRVEKLTSENGFSTITVRAVGSIKQSYHLCRHLIGPVKGKLLIMKGEDIKTELLEMTDAPVHINIIDLDVPGLSGKRKLVEISPLPQDE